MAKILVVEDEFNMQQLIKEVLEQDRHTVVTCDRGGEVLETIRREKPDLMILDVMLPEMDGYSLQTEVSRDASLSDLKVIVVTAQSSFLKLFGQFRQVVGTLSKPYQIAQLRETVAKALG